MKNLKWFVFFFILPLLEINGLAGHGKKEYQMGTYAGHVQDYHEHMDKTKGRDAYDTQNKFRDARDSGERAKEHSLKKERYHQGKATNQKEVLDSVDDSPEASHIVKTAKEKFLYHSTKESKWRKKGERANDQINQATPKK